MSPKTWTGMAVCLLSLVVLRAGAYEEAVSEVAPTSDSLFLYLDSSSPTEPKTIMCYLDDREAMPLLGYLGGWARETLGVYGGAAYFITESGELEGIDMASGNHFRLAPMPGKGLFREGRCWIINPLLKARMAKTRASALGKSEVPKLFVDTGATPEQFSDAGALFGCLDLRTRTWKEFCPGFLSEGEPPMAEVFGPELDLPAYVQPVVGGEGGAGSWRISASVVNGDELIHGEAICSGSPGWYFAGDVELDGHIVPCLGHERGLSAERMPLVYRVARERVAPCGENSLALLMNRVEVDGKVHSRSQTLFVWDVLAGSVTSVPLEVQDETHTVRVPGARGVRRGLVGSFGREYGKFCLAPRDGEYTIKRWVMHMDEMPLDDAPGEPGHGFNFKRRNTLYYRNNCLGWCATCSHTWGPRPVTYLEKDASRVFWCGNDSLKTWSVDNTVTWSPYTGKPRALCRGMLPIGYVAKGALFSPEEQAKEGWAPWNELALTDLGVVRAEEEWADAGREGRKARIEARSARDRAKALYLGLLRENPGREALKLAICVAGARDKEMFQQYLDHVDNWSYRWKVYSQHTAQELAGRVEKAIDGAAEECEGDDAALKKARAALLAFRNRIIAVGEEAEVLTDEAKAIDEQRKAKSVFWVPGREPLDAEDPRKARDRAFKLEFIPEKDTLDTGEEVECLVRITNESTQAYWVEPPSLALGAINGCIIGEASIRKASECLVQRDKADEPVLLRLGEAVQTAYSVVFDEEDAYEVAIQYVGGEPEAFRGVCRAPIVGIQVGVPPATDEERTAHEIDRLLDAYARLEGARNVGGEVDGILISLALHGERGLGRLLSQCTEPLSSNVLRVFAPRDVFCHFERHLDQYGEDALRSYFALLAEHLQAPSSFGIHALDEGGLVEHLRAALGGSNTIAKRALLKGMMMKPSANPWFPAQLADDTRALVGAGDKELESLARIALLRHLKATEASYCREAQEHVDALIGVTEPIMAEGCLQNYMVGLHRRNRDDPVLLRDIDRLIAVSGPIRGYDEPPCQWLRRAAADPTEARFDHCTTLVAELEKKTGQSLGPWPQGDWGAVSEDEALLEQYQKTLNAWADYIEKKPVNVTIP